MIFSQMGFIKEFNSLGSHDDLMNNPYSKILVPFDGSKFAKKAVQIAQDLARDHNSSLYVINVVDISAVNPPGKIHSVESQKSLAQIRKAITDSARSQINKIQEECVASGILTRGFVLEGLAHQKILQFIKENNIDLVVIGSRGLSGLSKVMALGSVSRRISELAEIPVIIVR